MGFFRNTPEEIEENRNGIKNTDLSRLSDNQLIMVALARFMESQGVDDEPLIQELYQRVKEA